MTDKIQVNVPELPVDVRGKSLGDGRRERKAGLYGADPALVAELKKAVMDIIKGEQPNDSENTAGRQGAGTTGPTVGRDCGDAWTS